MTFDDDDGYFDRTDHLYAQSAEERREDCIAAKAADMRAECEYIDMIDAIDSAIQEDGQPAEAEFESLLRGEDSTALGVFIHRALKRYFHSAADHKIKHEV